MKKLTDEEFYDDWDIGLKRRKRVRRYVFIATAACLLLGVLAAAAQTKLDEVREAFELCENHRTFTKTDRGVSIHSGYGAGYEKCTQVQKLWKEESEKHFDAIQKQKIDKALQK